MGLAHKIRQLLVGAQSAFLTAVTATRIDHRLDEAEIKTAHEVETYAEVGNLSPGVEAQLVATGVEGMRKGKLTYEDGPYLGEALCGTVAPVGAGPYVRTYTNPHGSAYTPIPETWEYGLGTALYKATGLLLTKLKLTVKKKEVWEFQADYAGAALSTLVSLASLVARTVSTIRAADTLLYIDAAGGTAGTTLVANTVVEASVEIDPKIEVIPYVGALGPQDYGINEWDGSLEITAEFNATVKALVDALLGGSTVERQYQLKATSGTKVFYVTFAGVLDGAGIKLWDDEQGNMVIKFKVKPVYNSTLGGWFKLGFTNSVAALP